MIFCCCGNAVLLKVAACARGPLPFTAVTIQSGGSTVASGTTDANAEIDISALPHGSYTVTASGFSGGRWAVNATFTVPTTIPATPSPFIINATIGAAPGYICSVCDQPISNRVQILWSNCNGFLGIDGTNNPCTGVWNTTWFTGCCGNVTGWGCANGVWSPGSFIIGNLGHITHLTLTCPPSLSDTFTTTIPSTPPTICTVTITELPPVP